MTKGKEAGRQSGGMDRQSGSMHHDGHLSEKITVSAQYGKNTVQQDRQKDLLPEERHKHVYGETIAKRKLLIVMIWHKTC